MYVVCATRTFGECPTGIVPNSCILRIAPGRYCGPGTAEPSKCASGTFSADTGLETQSECLACTSGHYCSKAGLTAPEGKCEAGYYCTLLADVASPADSSGYGGLCPAGHYCPEGTGVPKACVAGKFSGRLGLKEESQWVTVDAG